LWAVGGRNEFGFGSRNIVDGAPAMDITFRRSLWALRGNLSAFPQWYSGGVVAIALATYGAWRLRRRPVTVLLAAILVVVPLGYLFYWGNVLIIFGRNFLGPHYYLALLIPASVLTAHGLASLANSRRALLYFGAAAVVVVTAAEFPSAIGANADATEIARAEHRVIDQTVAGPAVVLLPRSRDGAYVLHPRGSMMNKPDLSDQVLYAADRSEHNIELFDRYPDRTIYRLQQSEGPTAGSPLRPNVRRLQPRHLTESDTATIQARNTTGAPVAQLYTTLGSQRIHCVIDRHSHTDQIYQHQVELSAEKITLHCPDGPHSVSRTDTVTTMAVGVAFGADENIAQAQLYELRFWSRTDNTRLTLVEPAEQWRLDPRATEHWRVTDNNPTVTLTLT
jgi:hypothetical protein